MLTTLAIHGYRSLRDVVLPLGPITLITGPNGVGKTSLYRALKLLSETASGRLIASLAHEGGLSQVLWAGPANVSRAMQLGEVEIQGTTRKGPIQLMLGFADEDMGYLIDIGLPMPRETIFIRDPEIKRELIFAPPVMRPSSTLVKRVRRQVTVMDGRSSRSISHDLPERLSVLSEIADPEEYPEALAVRRLVNSWRFYDSFRVDRQAPARLPQVGTWTPVMADDGSDFVPAVQTILESAFADPFRSAVAEAFPGGEVGVIDNGSRLELQFYQRGLLRPMAADELSDGTLRFLLLATALCSPRPASLMVLNEPETSLHPELLPVLATLISKASTRTQTIVVSHSTQIVDALGAGSADEDDHGSVVHHQLTKRLGETIIENQGLLTKPQWNWGTR